jgi:hypothetical protein
MNSPVAYAQRYLDLSIPRVDTGADLATRLRVSKYLLGLKSAQSDFRAKLLRKLKKDLAAGRAKQPGYAIRVRVRTATDDEERRYTEVTSKENDPLWMLIRYPFAGKGSPEGIQAALQLAATDGPGEKALVAAGKLQETCDQLLGVDCNGFVGSFLRFGHQATPWWNLASTANTVSANDLISTIWRKASGVERKSPAEVDPKDLNLLVLVDSAGKVIPGGKPPHGHIAISEPGRSTSTKWTAAGLRVPRGTMVPAILVTESTGAKQKNGENGVVTSWYHYVSHPRLGKQGVFLVHRGLNGKTMAVRIKALS